MNTPTRTVRLSDDLWEDLKKEALRRSQEEQKIYSVSDIMRTVLVSHLEEQRKLNEQVDALDAILRGEHI